MGHCDLYLSEYVKKKKKLANGDVWSKMHVRKRFIICWYFFSADLTTLQLTQLQHHWKRDK